MNTGKTFKANLFLLTIFSSNPDNWDNFLSENPIDLILLNSIKFLGKPFLVICFSASTISLICSKNQGSIFDNLYILVNLIFLRIASAINKILFGIFVFNFFSISFLPKLKILSKPEKPTSKDTNDFWRDSLKFLPMAIASPTDFIEVPNIAGELENFSKVNLGTLVTT